MNANVLSWIYLAKFIFPLVWKPMRYLSNARWELKVGASVTLPSWTILAAAEATKRRNGSISAPSAADDFLNKVHFSNASKTKTNWREFSQKERNPTATGWTLELRKGAWRKESSNPMPQVKAGWEVVKRKCMPRVRVVRWVKRRIKGHWMP